MKERYFVGTVSNENPEIVAVYWFERKTDAINEAQRRRDFYTKETTVYCKVLNVPSSNAYKSMGCVEKEKDGKP